MGERDRIAFTELPKILGMTTGNPSAHLRKLEDAGYAGLTEVIEGRSPATYVSITSAGRAACSAYRTALRRLLDGET